MHNFVIFANLLMTLVDFNNFCAKTSIRHPFGVPDTCLRRSDDQEGAGTGCQFNLACGLFCAAQAGQFVIFAQNQFAAVEQHGAAAELAVAGECIAELLMIR